MSTDLVPDPYPDITSVDWKQMDDDGKRAYWRERKLEWLSSDHATLAGFCRARSLEYSQYWTDGWVPEKEMIVQNAELMVSRMFEGQIADIVQLAYAAEHYAVAKLTEKLKKEGITLKVKDLVQIITTMRAIQGKPSTVESGKITSGKADGAGVQIFDIDGQHIKSDVDG